METHVHENAAVWDSQAGAFISSKHQRLAELLGEYNPYFSLVWIPPKDRDATDTKPFAILNSSPARPPHIIRYLSEGEMENPAEIVAWIFEGDLARHRPVDVIDKIEARERAEKAIALKLQMDEQADREEFADFVFGASSPNFFRHNGQKYEK